MSHNAVDTDTWPATVPVPDIADTTYPQVVDDLATALNNRTFHDHKTLVNTLASFESLDLATISATLTQYVPHPLSRLGASNFWTLGFTALLQNFRWLKEKLPGIKKDNTLISFPPEPVNAHVAAFGWESLWGSDLVSLVQNNNASTDIAYFHIPIAIRSGQITTVQARVIGDVAGGSAHGSTLPANRPTLSLYRYVVSGAGIGVGLVGTVTDPSASAAAYDAAHTITLTSISEPLDTGNNTLFWMIKMTGEHGADSIADKFAIRGFDVTIYGGNL